MTISVLSNDIEIGAELDITTIEIASQPTHGTAIPNLDGTITYTPNDNYEGIDSFNYTVKDNNGIISNSALVEVTINDNAPEVKQAIANVIVDEDAATTEIHLRDVFDDPDGDPIELSINNNNQGLVLSIINC